MASEINNEIMSSSPVALFFILYYPSGWKVKCLLQGLVVGGQWLEVGIVERLQSRFVGECRDTRIWCSCSRNTCVSRLVAVTLMVKQM